MAKTNAKPKPIKLLACLGNPGEEYANTRHNAGFRVADALAEKYGATYWKSECGAATVHIKLKLVSDEGPIVHEIVVAKPLSFMNTSGGPVSKLCALYDVSPEELLVVHDELDIPAGDVRTKFGGGHAGHNGLKSIIEKLGGCRDFSRVRVGIGRPPGSMDPADFVLRELRGADAEDFDVTVQTAVDAVEAYIAETL